MQLYYITALTRWSVRSFKKLLNAWFVIFTKLKAGKSDEHFITTMGDICYNLEGVPDIEINKCRIMGAREDDCMQRLKWDDKILSPNPSVDRNY